VKIQMKKACCMSAIALMVVFVPSYGLCDEVYWQGPVDGVGEWSVTNYWPGGTLPTAADRVWIRENRTALVGDGTAVTGTAIVVENRTADAGVLRLDGGVLTNVTLTVGSSTSYPATTGRMEIVRGIINTTQSIIVGGYGRVDMTGGEVSTYRSYVGGASGCFVQDGGTNRVPVIYVGYIGNMGQYSLNDGLLEFSTAIIGAGGTGQKGYMEINGGEISPGATFEFPQNTRNEGELALNNVTNSINVIRIAGGGNNTRHSYTGLVSMAGCDIELTTLDMANKISNCCARLVIDSGKLWCKNSVSLLNNTDNQNENQAILTVTNGAALQISTTEDISASSSVNLQVGNGGELRIHGGTVLIADRLFLGAGGVIEMTDGVFLPNRIFSTGGGLTTPSVFLMKGGLLALRTTSYNQFYLGGDANSVPNSQSQVPVTFIQTGGVVSNTAVVLSRASTNAVTRYEISGGALAPNFRFQINVPDVSELCIKGSAPDLTMGYIIANDDNFLLECVLDKSLGHLAPMQFTSTSGYRCGHLRARLDGGVMLSATNDFTVMKKLNGTFDDTRNYLSVPDESLWVTSLVAGATESAVKLTGKQADLAMNGQKSAAFTGVPMGHVTVAGLTTNHLIELVVRMQVTAANGSPIGAGDLS